MVREINTSDEYNQAVATGKVVVDFYANWCGPCVAIKDFYAGLASSNPGVTFLKVNVDTAANKGAMATAGVKCMPTFVFYHDGKQVDKLEGASKDALNQKVTSLNSK